MVAASCQAPEVVRRSDHSPRPCPRCALAHHIHIPAVVLLLGLPLVSYSPGGMELHLFPVKSILHVYCHGAHCRDTSPAHRCRSPGSAWELWTEGELPADKLCGPYAWAGGSSSDSACQKRTLQPPVCLSPMQSHL